MHQFICKAVGRKIVPLQQSKLNLLNKLLDSYSDTDKCFKLTIEIVEKNINEQQISLYKAFIIKASEYFGNTYHEMEIILRRFNPIYNIDDYKPINLWTTKELDTFINQATALLAEQGFKFE